MKKNMFLFTLQTNKTEFERIKVSQATDAAQYARRFYLGDMEIFESSFILLLNRSNTTIGYAKISQGGVAGTYIDPKIIAKYAVESLASYVILFHNHPSGNLTPSKSDTLLTEKVRDGLSLLDIKLMDHIILTTDGFFSSADEDMM